MPTVASTPPTVDEDSPPDSIIDKTYRGCRNLMSATTGITLYDWQRQVFRRMVESILAESGNEIVVECSRQSGKSTLMAGSVFALTLMLPSLFPQRWPKGFRVGIYAPTFEKSQIIFRILRSFYDRSVLQMAGISIEQSRGDTILLSNGSYIRCLTAGKDSIKEGETWNLIVMDESQAIEAEVIKRSLIPMLTATGGTRVMIGTPWPKKDYFYDSVVRLEGSQDCFIVDVDRVIEDRRKMYENTEDRIHLAYEKQFNKELEKRGKDDEILSQYYLKWPLERGMFCTAPQLISACNRYERVKSYDLPVYAGWDIAKEMDRSILTIASEYCPYDMEIPVSSGKMLVKKGEVFWDEVSERNCLFILDWAMWEGDDYPKQVGDVVAILDNYPKLEHLTIDETGVGKVIKDLLKNTKLAGKFNGFDFGQGGQKLSELWGNLQNMLINRKMIRVPLGPNWEKSQGLDIPLDVETSKFVEEVLNAEKVFRGQLLKVAAPEGRGLHDDYVASLAVLNYGVQNFGGIKVTLMKNKDGQTLGVDQLFQDEPEDTAVYEGRQRMPEHFKGT